MLDSCDHGTSLPEVWLSARSEDDGANLALELHGTRPTAMGHRPRRSPSSGERIYAGNATSIAWNGSFWEGLPDQRTWSQGRVLWPGFA